MCIYPIGVTDACRHAAGLLEKSGFPVIDHPSPDITHLLLDVPSFQRDGSLRNGSRLEPFLRMLPQKLCVIGGNLKVPMLEGYRTIDLMQDPFYVSMNAAITADCALRLAGNHMNRTFSDSSALVIGWGRIGKVLAKRLRDLGCSVTVAARKESDRAIAQALGFGSIAIDLISTRMNCFTLLFNTVPFPVLEQPIPPGCIALELASIPGIPSEGAIPANGLPGKMAPISSGALIAEAVQKSLKEELL